MLREAALPRVARWVYPVLGATLVFVLTTAYFEAYVTRSFSSLSPSNAYWLAHESGKSLFGYVFALFNGSVGDKLTALFDAGSFVFFMVPLAAYSFLYAAFRRFDLAVLGSLLVLFYPGELGALQASAFGALTGFVLIFPALYVANAAIERFSEARIAVFLILSVGVSLGDPILGMILGASAAPAAALAYSKGAKRGAAVPVLGFAAGLIAYFALASSPSLAWGSQSDVVLYLALVLSGLAVLMNRRKYPRETLLLGSFAAFSALFSFLFLVPYVADGLLLLSSTAIIGRKDVVARVTGEGELVEVDFAKLASMILIVLVLLSSLAVTNGYANSLNASSSYVAQKYGSTELYQALNWLEGNTPPSAVILSEHPLSAFIQGISGRSVVTNSNISPNSQSFQRSYDADTLLNATYEMRNGYVRVRDWAPAAPQRSPVIGVSNGSTYLDILYQDESYFHLLDRSGAEIPIPYWNYTKVQSGFVNGTDGAVLRQVYDVDGATVARNVTLGGGALATISYSITAPPTRGISGVDLKLWVPWARQTGFVDVGQRSILLNLDAGQFNVNFSGPIRSLEFGPDPVGGQSRAFAVYTAAGGRVSFTIQVSGSNVVPVSWSHGPQNVSSSQLISKYKVAYAVIPTIVKARFLDLFGAYSPTFTSVYQNDKLTIYKVTLS